jgi:hypothetical protein
MMGIVTAATPASAPTPESRVQEQPERPGLELRGRIGWVVASSLAAGLVGAVILIAAPFMPPTEAGVTGAVLCGFALGWAMLTLLSARFTDQPQTWATAPALLMGIGGLLLVAFGSPVLEVLTWVRLL